MTVQQRDITDSTTWNTLVRQLPDTHLLQSWEWGDFKSRYGWHVEHLSWTNSNDTPVAAAQVLQRRIAPGFSLFYCPRGPLLDWGNSPLLNQVLSDLKRFTQSQGAIYLKIEPGVVLHAGTDQMALLEEGAQDNAILRAIQNNGYVRSADEVQFRNTMTLNLTKTEEELLAGMKQKTRYNIRLASRRGVKVSLGNRDDFEILYRMYAETSMRDNFTIRGANYYKDVWESFHHAGIAQPMLAHVDGQPIAGLIVFRFGNTAWFLYGMSRDVHRDKMPNYLLQWEAIRWAKAIGCDSYDFWGAPATLDDSDPLWGVYRFKSGFGAAFIQTPGAWDVVVKPLRFKLYNQLLPKILSLLRRRGRSETQRAL
jgi:lipid II:glycine glycyltransferase (peptidoglycan interpeptide bridge formation enzyme)